MSVTAREIGLFLGGVVCGQILMGIVLTVAVERARLMMMQALAALDRKERR